MRYLLAFIYLCVCTFAWHWQMHFDYLCESVQLVECVPIRSGVCAFFVCVYLRKNFSDLFVSIYADVFLRNRERFVFVPTCANLCETRFCANVRKSMFACASVAILCLVHAF